MFSLRPGWIFLVVFVYVIGIILGSTYNNDNTDATWTGTGAGSYTTTSQTSLGQLAQMQKATQQNPIVSTITLVTNPAFWTNVYRLSTWQFSFMYDTSGNFVGGFFYWIVCFPFVAMFMLCMLIMLISILRGNITFG